MGSGRTVSFEFETILYKWEDVPEGKFRNWQRMQQPFHYDPSSYEVIGFPYILQVEPTNMCNLSCPLCPAGQKGGLNRERRNMTLGEFKGLIDDMEGYLLFLILWDWGEPFLNPDLPEMIRYASDRGIKVITSTNGQSLGDREYTERILGSGLETLIVAIDSVRRKNYERYRKGGDLEKAVSGLKTVVRLKRDLNTKTLLHLRMVITKSNEDEISEMIKFARKIGVGRFSVKTANPSRGLTFLDRQSVPDNPRYRRYAYKEGTYERIRKAHSECRKVYLMSNVTASGDVIPCCYDFDSGMKVGNVKKRPFTEIWNSLEYKDLRKRISEDKDSLPKCRDCDINFQLSEAGWFPVAIDLTASMNSRVYEYAKKRAKSVLPGKIYDALRRMRSITQGY